MQREKEAVIESSRSAATAPRTQRAPREDRQAHRQVGDIAHEVRIASRTKSGKPRSIELDGPTVAALRAVRARQAQERLLLGPVYIDNDLVFARPDGHPQHPEHFSMAFDRRVARYRLPRIRLHDLRHTWATLALSAGVDVKIVSERLGQIGRAHV